MCNGTSQEYDEAGDLAYLDIRIIQMERRLLETVADAVAPMGWKAHFAELFLEDGTLTANVRVSLNRSHPDAVHCKDHIELIVSPALAAAD